MPALLTHGKIPHSSSGKNRYKNWTSLQTFCRNSGAKSACRRRKKPNIFEHIYKVVFFRSVKLKWGVAYKTDGDDPCESKGAPFFSSKKASDCSPLELSSENKAKKWSCVSWPQPTCQGFVVHQGIKRYVLLWHVLVTTGSKSFWFEAPWDWRTRSHHHSTDPDRQETRAWAFETTTSSFQLLIRTKASNNTNLKNIVFHKAIFLRPQQSTIAICRDFKIMSQNCGHFSPQRESPAWRMKSQKDTTVEDVSKTRPQFSHLDLWEWKRASQVLVAHWGWSSSRALGNWLFCPLTAKTLGTKNDD